jgi:hypothetical protein
MPNSDRKDGTQEYPAGTDAYPDSEEAGSEEYPAGTGAYPAPEGRIGEEPAQAPEGDSSTNQEWWERAGFASLEEALADNEARWDRIMGRPVRDLKGLSKEEILFSDPVRRPSVTRHRVRERQVGVKLTADEYSHLVDAARHYGVAPSTLARIFVVRGGSRPRSAARR